MKIRVDFTEFKKVIKELNYLKNTSGMPILDNIKLVTNNGTIELSKTNIDTTTQVKCNVEIEEDGEIILPFSTIKLLNNIKKNCELTITETYIQIDKKKIEFTHIPVEDFLELNFKANTKQFSITEKELYRLLEVNYATAQDETRPVLTGINIKNNKFAAIDGYRLSIRESEQFTSNLNITMCHDQWTVLSKLIDKKSDGIINVYTDEKNKDNKYTYLRYELNDINLESRLLEGDYIKYEQILLDTREAQTILHIDDEELKDKFDLLSKLNNKNLTKINIANNIIEIKASDKENTIKDEVKGNITGEDLLIGFNNKYILDIIKQHKNNFNIYLYSNVSPAIFTQDNKNLELLLPVRLSYAS